VQRIAANVAAAFGLAVNVLIEDGTPPIVNPPRPTSWARSAAATLLGSDNVVPLGFLNLAGEDFAHYMERVPGCFLRIGAREPGGETIPAHAPRFYAAEESIFVGAAVLAETARVACRELANAP
jgi:metal-dependent amidase/aminoacylase/carboxypeptidase family protein